MPDKGSRVLALTTNPQFAAALQANCAPLDIALVPCDSVAAVLEEACQETPTALVVDGLTVNPGEDDLYFLGGLRTFTNTTLLLVGAADDSPWHSLRPELTSPSIPEGETLREFVKSVPVESCPA